MEPKQSSPRKLRYANFLRVGYSREEFVLDFGQYRGGEGDEEIEILLHTGIVATPQSAQDFQRIIAESVENWLRDFRPAGETKGKP